MLTQPDHSHQSPRVRHRGLGLVSCIWLLAFVSAGLWLLLGPSATDSQKQIAEVSAQPTELASFHQPVDSRYRNIEQIRVGQRVVTPEASSAAGLPTAVDPLTWKKLTLQAKARWEDGTIDDIEVQTLQPSSWLALHQAVVGASVPIPLDLREMGLPQMNATVMAIDPCPVIEEGPGRVVLTTVNHLNRFLFDLTVHGKRGPPQAVEVTGWHKLFSEDRQAWTSVCELHLGEVLRGRDGELTVESLAKHPGVQRVYNLTVEEEHQYYVSTADVLAHNENCAEGGVYLLRDPETGQVMRTGRTSNLARREAQHALDPALKDYEFEAVYRTDNYAEQRGLEQELDWIHNPPLNYIRPIRPGNPNLLKYLRAANGYLDKVQGITRP